MWIITELGFFSIVQKPEDKASGMLTVRSRVRSDLESLGERHLKLATPITEYDASDYRYRAKARQADVAVAMASLAASIDYSNFKDRVAKVQGKPRAHVYGEVWQTLFGLQSPKYEKTPASGTALKVPKSARAGKKLAAGGVLIDAKGRVLLREPANHFDGYVWTFPKGRVDKGEDIQAAALREAKEETGYDAEIICEIDGAFEGGTTVTYYYLMRPKGVQGAFDKETASTRWVNFDEATTLIMKTTNAVGRERDLKVLLAAQRRND